MISQTWPAQSARGLCIALGLSLGDAFPLAFQHHLALELGDAAITFAGSSGKTATAAGTNLSGQDRPAAGIRGDLG